MCYFHLPYWLNSEIEYLPKNTLEIEKERIYSFDLSNAVKQSLVGHCGWPVKSAALQSLVGQSGWPVKSAVKQSFVGHCGWPVKSAVKQSLFGQNSFNHEICVWMQLHIGFQN